MAANSQDVKTRLLINDDQYTAGLKRATDNAKKFGKDSSAAMRQASKGAERAGKATSKLGNQAQQASYQITDFVVQVQGGQGALRAFGQQAPQLLAIFGPMGAAVGTAAALASAIASVAMEASKAAPTIDELAGNISDLTEAQKQYALISLAPQIEEQQKSINSLNQRIATLNNYQEKYGKLTEGQAEDLIKLTVLRDKEQAALDKLTGAYRKVDHSLNIVTGRTVDAKKAISELSDAWRIAGAAARQAEADIMAEEGRMEFDIQPGLDSSNFMEGLNDMANSYRNMNAELRREELDTNAALRESWEAGTAEYEAQIQARINAEQAIQSAQQFGMTMLAQMASMANSENKKIAEAGQAAAMGMAVVNTAQAITKAYADWGYPWGVAAGAAIGAMGAVQVATIAGAFADGGDFFAGTDPILVGEEGPELIMPRAAGTVATASETSAMMGGDTIIIQAMDSKSFDQYARRNSGAITSAAKREKRRRAR